VLIFQGDPWVLARDTRESDLMLAEEGSVRGVSESLCPPELLTSLCCAQPFARQS